MTEHLDPYSPAPGKNDPGRLTTHALMLPGWPCRICPNLLAATPGGAIVCLNCDLTGEPTDA